MKDSRINLNMCEHVAEMIRDQAAVLEISYNSIPGEPVPILILNYPNKKLVDQYEIHYCPVCGKPIYYQREESN